jgi:hypothetical protein
MTRRLFFLLTLLLLTACTSENWTDRLPYAGPVEIGIDRGGFLPGTGIQYLSKTQDGAQVLIGEKKALKKIGDSLDWKADVLKGVNVDQTLRVALITEETLHAAGTVRVIVLSPVPQPEPLNTSAPVHFKLPVGYHVEKGQAIPGTVISFLGKTDEGAHLGNVEGYAYRRAGDSIVWKGKLREGVWIELDLRTVIVTESVLDVVGTADLWIAP